MTEPTGQEAFTGGVSPWLIALAVMLATFMEVLDTAIVSVALPYIAGSLSATNSEATWVLTSYLVANAVILPAANWFALRFGRKRFLVICVLIFTASSFLCGIAPTLGFILLARIVQGAGGGALQPLSQAILLESFEPRMRGVAMAVFGFGVVVAPVLGPTLGGWLTDTYSWRYAFYINIPVGILAAILIGRLVHDPPYVRHAKVGKFDNLGLGLLVVWTGCFQVVLDKGQEADWFGALWVRIAVTVFAISLIWFIVHACRGKAPVVDLRVLKDRNFAVGCLLIMAFGVAIYSLVTVLPLFYQELLGYTAFGAGIVVFPSGIGAILGMPVIGFLEGRVDARYLLTFGFLVFGITSLIFGNVDLSVGPGDAVLAYRHHRVRAQLRVCAHHHRMLLNAAERADRQRHGHLQPGAQCGRIGGHFSGANPADAALGFSPEPDRQLRAAHPGVVSAADGQAGRAVGRFLESGQCGAPGAWLSLSSAWAAGTALGVCGCLPLAGFAGFRLHCAGVALPQSGATARFGCGALRRGPEGSSYKATLPPLPPIPPTFCQ